MALCQSGTIEYMLDWKVLALTVVVAILALVGAVACVRNGAATPGDDPTAREALQEAFSFCQAHQGKLPVELLERARRAIQRHDWIEAAKVTLDALAYLRDHFDPTLPDRVIAAEAILRGLLNGVDSEE